MRPKRTDFKVKIKGELKPKGRILWQRWRAPRERLLLPGSRQAVATAAQGRGQPHASAGPEEVLTPTHPSPSSPADWPFYSELISFHSLSILSQLLFGLKSASLNPSATGLISWPLRKMDTPEVPAPPLSQLRQQIFPGILPIFSFLPNPNP